MHTAFSMLYEGARNNTAEEMQQTFGFEPDHASRHNSTAHLISSINRDDPDATLDMANSLWLADWFVPYESYTDVVRSTYLAEIESVDFLDVGDAGGVPRINAWANEKTHGKIPKVLEFKDVDGTTAAALLNAIYFKGTWKTQFSEENTLESDFWTAPAQRVGADFMNMKGSFDMVQIGQSSGPETSIQGRQAVHADSAAVGQGRHTEDRRDALIRTDRAMEAGHGEYRS